MSYFINWPSHQYITLKRIGNRVQQPLSSIIPYRESHNADELDVCPYLFIQVSAPGASATASATSSGASSGTASAGGAAASGASSGAPAASSGTPASSNSGSGKNPNHAMSMAPNAGYALLVTTIMSIATGVVFTM